MDERPAAGQGKAKIKGRCTRTSDPRDVVASVVYMEEATVTSGLPVGDLWAQGSYGRSVYRLDHVGYVKILCMHAKWAGICIPPPL